MSFLYPAFLFALSAIAIPIIIHLFRFRRFKTIYFTNVRFLREIKAQKASRARLKHLLVLAARIMTLIFLVFAFSQPYIPADHADKLAGVNQVSIFVDNSFSMMATGTEGTLLDEAKAKARAITKAYGPETRFQLLTHDLEGRHQHLVNREQFLSWLEEVEITPQSRTLSQIMERQRAALRSAGEHRSMAYLINDLQKHMFDTEQLSEDTLHTFSFMPIRSAVQHNIYIDSCWFEAPVLRINHIARLVVRLRNSGTQDMYNVRLAYHESGQQKALSNVDIPSGEAVHDTISFTLKQEGWQHASVGIHDDPITYDDTYYLTYEVVPHIRILAIDGGAPSPYLEAIFRDDEYYQYTTNPVGQLDHRRLSNYNFIVLHHVKSIASGLAQELQKFIAGGGHLAIFPPAGVDLERYRSFLDPMSVNHYQPMGKDKRQVNYLNVHAQVFRDVFSDIPENINLPNVEGHYPLTRRTHVEEEVLLGFREHEPFMAGYRHESGQLYLSTVPLDKSHSNLVNHAVFVPMLYKMALLSSNPRPPAYTLGEDELIKLDMAPRQAEDRFRITRGEFAVIPEQQRTGGETILKLHDQLDEAGVYTVLLDNHPDFETPVAFNYNRKESELDYFSPEELAGELGAFGFRVLDVVDREVSRVLAERDIGRPLWKYCIIFALAFLATEILLLRLLPERPLNA